MIWRLYTLCFPEPPVPLIQIYTRPLEQTMQYHIGLMDYITIWLHSDRQRFMIQI